MQEGFPQGVSGLLDRLGHLQGVERVFLFGSRARGDAAPRSDFDLAIDAPSLSDAQWGQVEEMVEGAETLYKIDCVWLQKASQEMKSNILRDAKVLFQR